MKRPRIRQLGERAVTIDFGNRIDAGLNDRVVALAASFGRDAFPGFVECLPAYSSLTVFYDPVAVRKAGPDRADAAGFVREFCLRRAAELSVEGAADVKTVEIPVSFAPEDAPDLADLAASNGLEPEETIGIFLAGEYRVYMLGFLPGFAYLGELDERIAAPRLETPRKRVPRGSVGIAGRQTGIYPFDSPGGWRLIGRTGTVMFDPRRDPPSLLSAGDRVKFVKAV